MEEKQEAPKGYYLAEVPATYQQVVAFKDKVIPVEELVLKMANALLEQGIIKE